MEVVLHLRVWLGQHIAVHQRGIDILPAVDLLLGQVAALFNGAVQVGVVVDHGVVLHPHGNIDHLCDGLPVPLGLRDILHRWNVIRIGGQGLDAAGGQRRKQGQQRRDHSILFHIHSLLSLRYTLSAIDSSSLCVSPPVSRKKQLACSSTHTSADAPAGTAT